MFLQSLLEDLLESKNVYFQPPESQKLNYPSIIYNLNYVDTSRANNKLYRFKKRYQVILIDRDPDSKFFDRFLQLAYCTFDRFYTENGLNHWSFNLYF